METQTTPRNPAARNPIHPLLATAAVSVTLASFVGIAAMTGWLPTGTAKQAEPTISSQSNAPLGARLGTPENLQPMAPAGVQQEPERTRQVEPKPAPKPAAKAAAAPKPVVHREPVQLAQAPQQAYPQPAPQNYPQPMAYPDSQAGSQNQPAIPPDYRPAPLPAPVAKAVCHDCGVIESLREVEKPGEGSGLGAVAGGVLGAIVGHQFGGGGGKKVAAVLGAAGGAYGGHQVEKRERGTTSYEVSVRMEDGGYRTVTFNTQPTWRTGDRVRLINGSLQAVAG